jgi:hypothetical protein
MADGKSKSSAVAICRTQIVPESDRAMGDYLSRPVPAPIRNMGDGRFRCYAVRFSGPDDKDLYGTYFDAETKYYLDYWRQRPWLHDHGLHPQVGRSKVGDWDEIGMDDQGVFVEGELQRHHKYRESIETLINEGVLYPSSGALNYLVRVADDGHVEDWPIGEVTSTVRPGDWRMLESISPAARSAMEMLLDEYLTEVETMGNSRMDELRALFGLRSEDAEPEVEPEAEPEVEDSGADECACDAEGQPDIVRAVLDAVEEEFATLRAAIEALDETARATNETLSQHSTLLAGLATEEVERTQRALADSDWLGSLYVATRDDLATEASDDEAESVVSARSRVDGDATGFELISGQVL